MQMVVTSIRNLKQNDPDMGILELTFSQLIKAVENGWAWTVSIFLSAAAVIYPAESVRISLGAALGFCLIDFLIGIIAAIRGERFKSKRVPDVALKVLGYSIAVYCVYTALDQVTGSADFARIVTTVLANVLLLRETVSILEHLVAMGVPLPAWAIRIVKNQLDQLNKKGEDLIDEGSIPYDGKPED